MIFRLQLASLIVSTVGLGVLVGEAVVFLFTNITPPQWLTITTLIGTALAATVGNALCWCPE